MVSSKTAVMWLIGLVAGVLGGAGSGFIVLKGQVTSENFHVVDGDGNVRGRFGWDAGVDAPILTLLSREGKVLSSLSVGEKGNPILVLSGVSEDASKMIVGISETASPVLLMADPNGRAYFSVMRSPGGECMLRFAGVEAERVRLGIDKSGAAKLILFDASDVPRVAAQVDKLGDDCVLGVLERKSEGVKEGVDSTAE